MGSQPIDIIYHVDCGGENRYTIPIRIDPVTLERSRNAAAPQPDWALRGRLACPDCPLAAHHTHCLAAVAISDLVDMFGHMLSYSEAIVRVDMPQRSIETRTTMQRVISSIAGLFMATSGCPSLTFLKPMARFHLPFASREETLFRSVSAYMLLQHFLYKQGRPCDLELVKLKEHYVKLSLVNHSIAKRLRALTEGDANINAVVLLDLFAQDFPHAIDKGLAELEALCKPALDALASETEVVLPPTD